MKYFCFLSCLFLAFSIKIENHFPEKATSVYWNMQGTKIIHSIEDKIDTLSGTEIIELQNEKGLPIWFGRYICKDVCMTGQCKLIRLWLFWDGVGNFLGFEIPEKEPLTKSDHTKFETKDYDKLLAILKDTASVLKKLKQEDLVIASDLNRNQKVDGYTAATQPTISEAVVKNAVYTCHTLWHTVYGPSQEAIHEIVKNKLNEQFLVSIFNSKNPAYILWAIQSIEEHPEFHETFFPYIINSIKSDNFSVSSQAINYFQPSVLVDTTVQIQLVKNMAFTKMNINYKIIWKFIELKWVDYKTVERLLQMVEENSLDGGAFNLISRLITDEHLNKDRNIVMTLKSLSKHENRYIKNLSEKILNENKSNETY